jgi:hypothetical protein
MYVSGRKDGQGERSGLQPTDHVLGVRRVVKIHQVCIFIYIVIR